MESQSIKGRICYRDFCPSCKKDKGFIPKAQLGRRCRGCTNSALKRGKPAWNKGLKTGRPAWNSKNIDPVHRTLRNRISRRLRHALSGRNLSKNWKDTFEVLGFTAETLKSHLESKFQPGMSWDNIGCWQIDHVTPDSWFNYNSMDDADFKKCWSLNNLQPMWADLNKSKGARFAGPHDGRRVSLFQ